MPIRATAGSPGSRRWRSRAPPAARRSSRPGTARTAPGCRARSTTAPTGRRPGTPTWPPRRTGPGISATATSPTASPSCRASMPATGCGPTAPATAGSLPRAEPDEFVRFDASSQSGRGGAGLSQRAQRLRLDGRDRPVRPGRHAGQAHPPRPLRPRGRGLCPGRRRQARRLLLRRRRQVRVHLQVRLGEALRAANGERRPARRGHPLCRPLQPRRQRDLAGAAPGRERAHGRERLYRAGRHPDQRPACRRPGGCHQDGPAGVGRHRPHQRRRLLHAHQQHAAHRGAGRSGQSARAQRLRPDRPLAGGGRRLRRHLVRLGAVRARRRQGDQPYRRRQGLGRRQHLRLPRRAVVRSRRPAVDPDRHRRGGAEQGPVRGLRQQPDAGRRSRQRRDPAVPHRARSVRRSPG